MSAETNRKILFVDDDPPILSAIRRNLGRRYDIHTAIGPNEAFDLIETHGAFSIVVSDMKMVGMDGMEFLGNVKQLHPQTVCIMLTGYAEVGIAIEAVNRGLLFKFLTKPCPADVLAKALDDAIQHSRLVAGSTSYTYSITVKDDELGSIERSSGCLAVTGYKPYDFTDIPSLRTDIILPEYRRMYIEFFRGLLAGRELAPIEFQIKTKEGHIRWLRDTVIPHRNEQGKVIRIDGLVEDITSFKDISQQLHESQTRYERMVSSVPGIVFQCMTDRNLNVEFLFVSDAINEILGIESFAVTENPRVFFDLFNNLESDSLLKSLCASAEFSKNLRWQGKAVIDGKQRWFCIVARPDRQPDGRFLWDGLLLDNTARMQMENELKKVNRQLREQSKLKTEFVSMVSHELRTPLFIFKNIISNALNGVYGWVGKKLRKNLQVADETIDRLTRIISDFLDCSKIETGAIKLDISQHDIAAVINETVHSFLPILAERKLKINCIVPQRQVYIEFDRDRIIQAITNLLSNAVKFSHDDGKIDVYMAENTDEVEISVQDYGPGISKEDLEKIFSKFVQVHKVYHRGYGGTGLGLSIARDLVEMHGGRIWVQSELGKGSCFNISLPKKTNICRENFFYSSENMVRN